jgi:hypothetical protein
MQRAGVSKCLTRSGDPAMERSHDELLPGLEAEGLAGVLALGEAEHGREKCHGAHGEGRIPREPAGWAGLEILEMSLTREPDGATGDDVPCGHRAGVGGDRIVRRGATGAPAGRP